MVYTCSGISFTDDMEGVLCAPDDGLGGFVGRLRVR